MFIHLRTRVGPIMVQVAHIRAVYVESDGDTRLCMGSEDASIFILDHSYQEALEIIPDWSPNPL